MIVNRLYDYFTNLLFYLSNIEQYNYLIANMYFDNMNNKGLEL